MKQHFLTQSFRFVTSFCLLLVGLTAAAQTDTLQLQSGKLAVATNISSSQLPAELEKGKWGNAYYELLVFEQTPTTDQLRRLRNNGVELLHLVTPRSFVVRLQQVPATNLLHSCGVTALYTLPGQLKTGPALQQQVINTNQNAHLLISVRLQPGVALQTVTGTLNLNGFSITNLQYSNQGLLIGTAPASMINTLASLPFVASVNNGYYEPQPLMQRERAAFGLTGLTSSQGAGRNLTGAGVTVAVGDNADPTSHIDNLHLFINRNPAFLFTTHGTHVNGVVSGDGIIEERLTGTAPGSRVVADFFDYVVSKSAVYTADYGLAVTNNSYFSGYSGCPGNGAYNDLSVYADEQLYNNPTLQHIFAAGNDGTLTCSPYPASFGTIKSGYQSAKNVLSVGNCDIFSTGIIANSSSRGPVLDGRIKPEIIASGVSVGGTAPSNSYTNNIGTSASAPYVTGVWALLTERYRQLHGNADPKSGLLKAVLCNTAIDKGNAGPDYKNGFGWISPQRAVAAIEGSRYYTNTVATAGNHQQTISVPAGTRQLKVLLYWHDRPATLPAPAALVNDLDLSVTDGVTNYRPWILDPTPAGVDNPATRGLDRLNNIEQVTIDNPGSSVTINVDGFNVPFGPQEFFISYEFVPQTLTLLHPYGGERFTTFSSSNRQEMITWQAEDNSSNTFTLEYSLDDGATWTLIANNISGTEFRYFWSVPDVVTDRARIRISRNGGGASDVSEGNFAIMGLPNLSTAVPCEGYVDLSWTATAGATSYEVMQLVNGVLTQAAIATTTSYRVSGLDKNTTYWFTVRPRIGDTLGRRAIARSVRPFTTSPCTDAAFDNDLKVDTVLTPTNGRRFTSLEPGSAATISVRIRNLDNAATAGSYNLSYQVNGGPVVTETSSAVIAAGGTIDYTFATPYDFSIPGPYTIRVTVKQTGDARTENDEWVYTIRHADNPPVVLPFIETFEATSVADYRSRQFAMPDADRFDFAATTFNGRLRTYLNNSMSINGNRSLFLDAAQFTGSANTNEVIATFNLNSYVGSPGLRFDFRYRNQGQIKQGNNFVWIRGRDDQPWIQAFDLSTNQGELGEIRQGWINVEELLTTQGQPLSTSFQVRIDQTGSTSSNNGVYVAGIPDLDDGFSFDDFRLSLAANDLTVTSLLSPTPFNCASGAAAVSIRIRNLSATGFTNVPVAYRVDNGAAVNAVVPSVPGNSTVDFVFPVPADLSAFRAYELDAWVQLPADTYAVNDSINNQLVYNSPVVNSYPYLERFESNNGNFFTTGSYSSWSWGSTDANSRLVLTTAANGNRAWFTRLAGTYKNNEESYLYSPCFNLSSLTNPVLSFAHTSQQEDGFDFHTIEYTTDNGISWQRLGTQGAGTNWFDVPAQHWRNSFTRWHVSSIDIPTNASSVRFRFLLSSDAFNQREGIGIDDIHIFERDLIYTGANQLNISQPVSGSNWVHFTSGGNLVASINPLGQNLGNTDVSVYIHSGAVRFINNQYYLDRNLVIRTANAPVDSVLVRFYFTDAEFNALFTANGCGSCSKPRDAFMVGVTKFSGDAAVENGTLADNTGLYEFINPANADVIPFNNGYYAEFKVRSFSEFWINSGGNNQLQPLPVTLLNFKGNKRFPHIDLSWETANESNSSHFVVERKLDDEPQFVPVGTVGAAGNSVTKNSYRFTDAQVLQKASSIQYRLQMVDLDGSAVYSQVLRFNHNNVETFIQGVFNNAGSNLIIATGNKPGIRDMQIRILNAAGQTVLSRQLPYQNSTLQLDGIAAGIYIIEIRDRSGKEFFVQKLIK